MARHRPTRTTRRPIMLALVVALLAAMLGAIPGTPGSAAEPDIEFIHYTGTGIDIPLGITGGLDGNVWFTNAGSASIGRITPDGVVANFTGTGIAGPYGIVAGPDGNLWFTNYASNSIGRITPDGTVTSYTGTGISDPYGIAAGPDGNLWFTNFGNSSIGRITPDGSISNYSGPDIANPTGITVGPDGNLWFTNQTSAAIGRITPDGTVSSFPDAGTGTSSAYGITVGPDGNLWFTNLGNSSIGRITPDGSISNYTGPGISEPIGIVAGPDGNLWFTNEGNNSIGRITPDGVVSNYTGTGASRPYGLTAGPDGNLWFTNSGNDSVGRMRLVPGACDPGQAGPFTDVPAGHTFCTQIDWLATSGITGGFPDGTFRPSTAVTRQAMASFLHRFAGEPEVTLTEPFFADVGGTHPFYEAIQWMAESGLSTGTPQPSGKPLYKPADAVARQAMAAFLWRFAGEPDVTLAEPFFADVAEAHPFHTPIQWMAESELSTGTPQPSGKPLYKPADAVARQAMAAFLQRFDENIAVPAG